MPRAFADRYFSAVSAFHSCDDGSWPPDEPWWQPSCAGGGGFQESVLFRHLHANDVAYRPYPMFDYYIAQRQREDGGVRAGGGGGGERGDGNGCDVRTAAQHDTACVILGAAGLLPSSYSMYVGCTRWNRLKSPRAQQHGAFPHDLIEKVQLSIVALSGLSRLRHSQG